MLSRDGSPAQGPRRAGPTRRRRYDLDRLLAVAVEVFTVRGYDGTSMEILAQASGLSKSSLYHHVQSKEQLLRLALDRAVGPLFAVLTEPDAEHGPAVERLAYVIRREVNVLVENLPYVTLLLRVRGNTETERWALARRRTFDGHVADLVGAAVDEGDLRAGLAPLVTARLVFGLINSLVEWVGHEAGHDVDVEVLADNVERLVFVGLRG